MTIPMDAATAWFDEADWLAELERRLCLEAAVVRIAIVATHGSAPREAGTVMLVDANREWGTIGGGHLEFKAISMARAMLGQDAQPARRDRFVLGATLGQCCGGAVELSFERFAATDRALIDQSLAARRTGQVTLWVTRTSHGNAHERTLVIDTAALAQNLVFARAEVTRLLQSRFGSFGACLVRAGDNATEAFIEPLCSAATPIWLYGAGHVGQALVRALAPLPFRVRWVDARTSRFAAPGLLPANVEVAISDTPERDARDAPDDAYHIVMTHSHDLDYEICRAILSRKNFARLGLIGSATKARRFAQRLSMQGITRERIERMTCPIGIAGIDSKLPASIAAAVVAQLLQWVEIENASCLDGVVPHSISA